LLTIVVFGAAAVFAAFVTIEAVARIFGATRPIGPVDYPDVWARLEQWNPSTAAVALIFAGVTLAGIAIALFHLMPDRTRTQVISENSDGSARLDLRSAQRFLRSRIEDLDGISKSTAVLKTRRSTVDVVDRPRTTRRYAQEDLTAARTAIEGDLRQLGLYVHEVVLKPRATQTRSRVR
jgi:hypothetical protein